MQGKATPKETILDILQNREKGYNPTEIAKKLHINRQTIVNILKRYKLYDGAGSQSLKERPVVEIEGPAAPSAQRSVTDQSRQAENHSTKLYTLKAFSSRQLIKELYDRGYRIEKDGLFVIEKKKVLVNDILNIA